MTIAAHAPEALRDSLVRFSGPTHVGTAPRQKNAWATLAGPPAAVPNRARSFRETPPKFQGPVLCGGWATKFLKETAKDKDEIDYRSG
jgi:hypothetical protein